MPHKNPKIQKMEENSQAVVKEAGKHHKGKNQIDRDVFLAFGHQVIMDVRSLYSDPTTLQEAVDHMEASLDAIADNLEANS